ncbi:LOB domain-containing protein 1-like [Senna tora]|uniref:LOB domain-containing protein 1-like n=1 Tax=Senna tora TaxID=362788 RepID=A0A835CIZ9_9FABA|nr:LOB domain-containing protein 1-like [Senna tora]
MVEETNREDAVKAIVYEAMARVRDPVYGSAGAIVQLQKMVRELKVELETMKARVSQFKEQRGQLLKNFHTNSSTSLHHHLLLHPLGEPLFDEFYNTLLIDPLEFPVPGNCVSADVEEEIEHTKIVAVEDLSIESSKP